MATLPAGYVEIPAVLLIAEAPAVVDISIFMPVNQKVVLYKRAGDDLSLDDVMHLRHRATPAIMKASELESAMQRISGELTSAIDVSAGRARARSILATTMTKDPEAPAEVKRAQLDSASQLASFILTKANGPPKASYYEKILAELAGDDRFSTHNRHVGGLAAMLLLALGGFTKDDVTDISLAGFFHDIYLRELPENISELHLNGEDLGTLVSKVPALNLYAHVAKVLERFAAEKVPASAAAMRTIVQHHENFDGSGLKGARGEAIYRPARVLRIADDMICLLNSPKKKHSLVTAYACLENLNDKMETPIYDPELLEQLGPVFG